MSRPITIDVDLDTGVAVVYGRLNRRDGLQAMAEIFRQLEADGWFSECKCLCETCRRDFLDDDDNSCCLEHIGRSCPVTACPDYLPEEAPPC